MTELDKELEAFALECEQCSTAANARVVYMRPNRFSDEAIAVAVLVSAHNAVYCSCVTAVAAMDALACLYGHGALDQLNFALNTLQIWAQRTQSDLADIEPPSDLLQYGPLRQVSCEDPRGFGREFLEMSSSLYRNYNCTPDVDLVIHQERICRDLYARASQFDALRATRLFRGTKIEMPGRPAIDIPIFGNKIFGAPISFVTRKVANAKMRAEAMIARFNYARRILERESVLYVLLPSIQLTRNSQSVDGSLEELEMVANANEVKLRHERNIDELAKAILFDDVA